MRSPCVANETTRNAGRRRVRRPRRGCRSIEYWFTDDKAGILCEPNQTTPVHEVGQLAHTAVGNRTACDNDNETVPESQKLPVPPLVFPKSIFDDPARCAETIRKLEDGDQDDRHSVISDLQSSMLPLAFSKHSCRVVQKATEVAGGPDRDMILREFQDHITRLYESPHGNHVLTRAIEVLPVAKVGVIVSALLGRCAAVSRHRFGCRVVCRLIEHCSEDDIGELLDEIVVAADSLARHCYGNYVVQTALEHASLARKAALFQQLLPGFAALANHQAGSLVAQRALDYCNAEDKVSAIEALLHESESLVETACSHFGSFVIAQIAEMRLNLQESTVIARVASTLAEHSEQLQQSQHARRVIVAFGFQL